MHPLKSIWKFIQNGYQQIASILKDPIHTHKYRVLHIENDGDGQYQAVIQIISKQQIFKMKPEDILSDDGMTDSFSQRDIRALTYLGYLGINSPKYKILAKRLSEDNKLIFAIKQKGQKKTIIKTAEEVSTSDEILTSLDQKDAHMVGFSTGAANVTNEAQEKERLIKAHKKNIDNSSAK